MFAVKPYLQKDFQIECSNIQAILPSENASEKEEILYEGPGIIRFNNQGTISFKMFNHNPASQVSEKYLNIFSMGDDNNQCLLRAYDYAGYKWEGWTNLFCSILADLQADFLITGKLDSLTTVNLDTIYQPSKKIIPACYLYYIQYPEFYYTSKTESETKINGEAVRHKYWRNQSTFNFRERKITLEKSLDEDYFMISAQYWDESLAPNVEVWLQEALDFCTASIVRPRLILRKMDNMEKITLLDTTFSMIELLPSPFVNVSSAQLITYAFACYLEYCLNKEPLDSLEFNDLTLTFLNVLHSSKGSGSNFLETLCIACEHCFDEITEDFVKSDFDGDKIDYLKKAIKQLDANIFSSDQKNRMTGLLKLLEKPSSNQKMRFLLRNGIITKNQMTIWNSYRNILSHGGNADSSDKLSSVRNAAAELLYMFYRLIYQIIGYSGACFEYDRQKGETVMGNFDAKVFNKDSTFGLRNK